MARFTISQLETVPTDYTVVHSDLLIGTIGTSTGNTLSSVRVRFNKVAEYTASTYSELYGLTINGNLSSGGGLSANGDCVAFWNLPSSDPGVAGKLYYQTSTQLNLDSLTTDDDTRFVIMSKG